MVDSEGDPRGQSPSRGRDGLTAGCPPAPPVPRNWNSAKATVASLWRSDSIHGRMARGAVWSLVGAGVAQGTSLAASIITARILGAEEFGAFGMIQSTVGMLGVFAGLGLGITATKFVAELRIRDPDRAGRIIAGGSAIAATSGGVLATGLVASATSLATSTLNAPNLVDDLRVASLVLFFNAVSGAQTGALSGFEAFQAISRVNLVRGVTVLPLTIGFVSLWGLHGAIWGLVVSASLSCLLNHHALRQQCIAFGIRPRLKDAWKERTVLWSFSTPAFLSTAMFGPILWAANTLLVNAPNGYVEMGIFNAASQWRNAILFLPGLLSQPVIAVLASVDHSDRRTFNRILRNQLLIVFATCLVIALPIIICADLIMNTYGAGFGNGATVLTLLVISSVMSGTANVIGQAIASLGRMWWGLAMNSVWAIALLAVAAHLIPSLGAKGLAAAFVASYTVHTVTAAAYVKFHLSRR